MRIFWKIALFLVSGASFGATLAKAGDVKVIYGVNTHLAFRTQSFAVACRLADEISVSSLRDEIYWNQIELSAGKLSASGMPLDVYRLIKTGCTQPQLAHRLITLGYGNPNYEDEGRPSQESSFLAFAKYAAFVASEIRTPTDFEIWNEWNLKTGRKITASGTAEDYLKLVRATIPAIRNTGFRGRILIGGVGGDWPDWAFTKKIASSNVLSVADGYSVHLYNFAKSSDPKEMMERLIGLQTILKAANGGKEFPVYITELGWPTSGKFSKDRDLSQAKLQEALIRFSELAWIRGVWIYELLDSNRAGDDIESSFGLFSQSLQPKAVTCQTAKVMQILRDQEFVRLAKSSDGEYYHYTGAGGNTTLLIRERGQGVPASTARATTEVQSSCDSKLEYDTIPGAGLNTSPNVSIHRGHIYPARK